MINKFETVNTSLHLKIRKYWLIDLSISTLKHVGSTFPSFSKSFPSLFQVQVGKGWKSLEKCFNNVSFIYHINIGHTRKKIIIIDVINKLDILLSINFAAWICFASVYMFFFLWVLDIHEASCLVLCTTGSILTTVVSVVNLCCTTRTSTRDFMHIKANIG